MDKVVKILLWTILVLFVAGTSVQIASAEQQSNQYVKQYMDPLYRQSMTQNIDYHYTLNVDTPDGISNVVNAMLTMQVWHNPTVNYYVWVNGQTCNTETFQVHTTYANAGEGTIYFDCSNVITGEGVYDITFRTDDDVGASTFWAELTYSNTPRPQMTFGATDYFTSEPEQLIFVQLTENTENGAPIDNAVCFAEVYASDATTHILQDAPMVHTEHGIYHLHVNILETGVHIVSVECFYEYNSIIANVSSTNTIYGAYERLPGTVSYQFFQVDGGTTTNRTSNVLSLGGTPIEIRLDWSNKYAKINTTATFTNGDIVKMYNKNINKLGDTIYLHNLAGTVIYGSYVITSETVYQWHNVTLSNTGAGVTQIYISDLSQGGAHDIQWDYIEVADPTGGGWFGDPDTSNSVSALRSENDVYWQAVEDASDRLEIEYTFTGISGLYNDSASLFINGKWSESTEPLNVSMYNYNTSTWDLLPNKITYSLVDVDTTNGISPLGDYVSAGTAKAKIIHTLTNTNYGVLKLDKMNLEYYTAEGNYVQDVKGGGEIHIVNVSGISTDVWASPDRQLTALNFDTTDEEGIWEYANRSLTDFNFTVDVNVTSIASSIWNYDGAINNSMLSQFAASVWSHVTRTLTAFDFFDYELQSNYTWNRSDRNLTYYEPINVTDISSDVWNSSARYTHGVELS